ncbi:MAG: hypothetical protein ACSHX8_02900 [Opitutaceae bacterium]
MIKKLHLYLSAFFSVVLSASALTVSLNFNDGTAGNALNSFYIAQGVTFENAEWNAITAGYIPAPESDGLRIVGIGADLQPKSSNPIIASFDQAMQSISIIANNVNLNGARIDAYDSLSGGNLLGFDEAFGSSGAIDSNFTLEFLGSGIRRIEFYQPLSAESEGVLFDNLTFSTVPEPSMFALALSIGIFTAACRRNTGAART